MRQLKTFISIFIVSILIASFILPNFMTEEYYAATVAQTTTKKKPKGHKIEGAEYYDELWNKFSVIAVDNGGGMGEGGGAGDNNSANAGNSGDYSENGGTFGQAAGVGLGTGNTANQAGTGAGTNTGYSGSTVADALRALKAQQEKERQESIAKVMETANDKTAAMESIEQRESIQASIQKRLQQESIKAKIAAPETTVKQYETPVYVEATTRKQVDYKTNAETALPTSNVTKNQYETNNVAPTEGNNVKFFDSDNKIAPVEIKIAEYEAGDVIEPTFQKNLISTNIIESIAKPTSAKREEPTTVAESTLKVYDAPIIEEESVAEESMAPPESNFQETVINENADKKEDLSDKEEGKGSKGGADAEKDQDQTGDDGEIESEGNADEHGQFQLETKGEFAGKKVFDLEQNGNIGLDPEHLAVTNMKGLMTSVLILLFALGALAFVLSTKDSKSKNNYF